MNRKLALKVQILCIALLLGAALACGGSEEATPTSQIPAVVTVTPPPAAPAGVQVLEATFARGIDEDGNALDPTDDFAPDEKVFLVLTLKGRPKGVISGSFYRGDEFLGEADVDLSDLNSGVVFSIGENTYVNFWMAADSDDPSIISDDYRIDASYDDEPIGSYPFHVAPPPDAIPSRIQKVTLARGADSDYNPVDPTTTFASNEDVYIVGRGDVGLYSRLLIEWYVDGQLDEAGTNDITVQENATDTGFYFSYAPDGDWPEGEHYVVLIVDDQEVGRYDFTVKETTMAPFEDPEGVFSLDYPADFDQIEEDRTDGYSYTFIAPDDSGIVYLYFGALGAPLSDDQWHSFVEEYTIAGMPGFGDDAVELERQLGEPGVHAIYMEVESEETGLHGLVWMEEIEGAVAIAVMAAQIEQWPERQAELSASLESFTWSPDAVHAVSEGQ